MLDYEDEDLEQEIQAAANALTSVGKKGRGSVKRSFSTMADAVDMPIDPRVRFPPKAYTDLKAPKELEEWLDWSKGVWKDLKDAKKRRDPSLFDEYRRAFTGIYEPRTEMVTKSFSFKSDSNEKLAHLTPEQSKKRAEDRLEKRLKTASRNLIENNPEVFDDSITSFGDVQLPVGVKTKFGDQTTTVIMIWDFLISYAESFQRTESYTWFDLNAFFDVLANNKDRHISMLMNEIMCGLLHVIRIQGPKKTEKNIPIEENRYDHPIVINDSTWPYHLKQVRSLFFLFLSGSDFHVFSLFSIIKPQNSRNENRIWMNLEMLQKRRLPRSRNC
jgi:hypothetical protein